MRIEYSKNFTRQFKKKDTFIRQRFLERQRIFVEDKFSLVLNNHSLHGEYEGCRSINITGDVRAVFEEVSENYIEFIAIGTHAELYS